MSWSRFSGEYGFHGDEMYYVVAGRHPAFGYVDQPPLTPLLSAASVALLGVSPTAVRLLPTVEMAAAVIIVACMCRDLGGARRAQLLAAITASLSIYLASAHLDTTTDLDLLAWALVLWLMVRLLAGADRRLWLAVGVVGGLGLENKDTLVFLAVGLAAGLLVARRWDVLRSPWAWTALGLAVLLWVPNLAWQAANDWPQLAMARAIAAYADDNRAQLVPSLWLFPGPFLFPVSAAGLGWVLFADEARPWRPIGIAALVALALVVVTGGKAYYAIGSVGVFMAAGGIVVDRWVARGHAGAKLAGIRPRCDPLGRARGAARAADPAARNLRQELAAMTVPDTANEVGWPRFVATVQGAVDTLTPDERAHAMILTNDYSEASPLILLGTDLPPVYSGHNAYWSWGPPPADRTVVVHVGDWRPADWSASFIGCHDVARIDDGLGIENGEQGKAVSVCTGLRAPWTALWPTLRTIS